MCVILYTLQSHQRTVGRHYTNKNSTAMTTLYKFDYIPPCFHYRNDNTILSNNNYSNNEINAGPAFMPTTDDVILLLYTFTSIAAKNTKYVIINNNILTWILGRKALYFIPVEFHRRFSRKCMQIGYSTRKSQKWRAHVSINRGTSLLHNNMYT